MQMFTYCTYVYVTTQKFCMETMSGLHKSFLAWYTTKNRYFGHCQSVHDATSCKHFFLGVGVGAYVLSDIHIQIYERLTKFDTFFFQAKLPVTTQLLRLVFFHIFEFTSHVITQVYAPSYQN